MLWSSLKLFDKKIVNIVIIWMGTVVYTCIHLCSVYHLLLKFKHSLCTMFLPPVWCSQISWFSLAEGSLPWLGLGSCSNQAPVSFHAARLIVDSFHLCFSTVCLLSAAVCSWSWSFAFLMGGGWGSWLPYSADSLWLGFASCVPWQIPVRNMREHSREIC